MAWAAVSGCGKVACRGEIRYDLHRRGSQPCASERAALKGPDLEVAALLRDLAAGRLPRLLLFHGPEPLLIEELIDRVAAAVVVNPANREIFYADTATPEAPQAIIAAGSTLPLFGGRRLVVVRGLADLAAKAVQALRAAIEQARARPHGWPDPETTVLLVAAGADHRNPALRLVGDAEQIALRAPSGRAVVAWLRERARAAGLELAPEAAQTLVDLVGDDLGRLAGELEKAAVYAGADRRVSEAVVRALVGETRGRQYWELTQALEAGNRADALALLEQLLAAGEEPLVLLAWVAGYLRNLWRALAQLGAAGDARQLARLLRPARPEWAAERVMARAAAVGLSGVTTALQRCFEVERALKTSAGSPRALLTVLVAELAR